MSTLILVKHSLPEIVENVPAREWKLSVQGRSRCTRLAERLAKYQPTQIISSVEPKAKETAELVAKELGLATSVVEDLHEHERSNAGYLPKEKFEESVREFFAKPNELVFGSETAEQAYQRFRAAVDSILRKYPDQTNVIVAHGTVISLYVSRFNEISGLWLWKQLGLPSFVVLDVESKSMTAEENIE
jgi:broad specificity phosphatase PhoE